MRRVGSLLAVVLLAAGSPAGAATFVVPSVEELARSSEVVVRGRVVDLASRLTPGGRIVTEVDVAVASAWKGSPDPTVRLLVRGGRVGKVALRVDAAPSFAVGDEVVLFLARRGATWRVNGQALGTFRVEGPEARTAIEGAALLARPLAAGERRVGTMPLDELERRVRAAR